MSRGKAKGRFRESPFSVMSCGRQGSARRKHWRHLAKPWAWLYPAGFGLPPFTRLTPWNRPNAPILPVPAPGHHPPPWRRGGRGGRAGEPGRLARRKDETWTRAFQLDDGHLPFPAGGRRSVHPWTFPRKRVLRLNRNGGRCPCEGSDKIPTNAQGVVPAARVGPRRPRPTGAMAHRQGLPSASLLGKSNFSRRMP